MSGYTITWGGVASTTITGILIQKVWRRTIGAVRDEAVSVPGRDGAYLFPENRGDRIIRAEGLVVAAPDLRHASVVELADWLDLRGAQQLLVDDQTDRFWLASVMSDPDPDEWKSTGKFVLEWRSEPYSYSVATDSQCATATNGDDWTITFLGNVFSEPIIEITPMNGDLTSFTLTVGPDTIQYDTPVTQGDTLTIDALTDTVMETINFDTELTGAYQTNTQFPGLVSGTFPVLEPGVNDISIVWVGPATQVRVCFRWRQRFR